MNNVYIPSMMRTENIARVLPHWLEHGSFDIKVVVAQDEFESYDRLLTDETDRRVSILPLPKRVKGVGAIRKWIVEYEVEHERPDYSQMIMSDDDIFPHHTADLWKLIETVEEPSVLGCGATTSYHSLLLGSRKDQLTGTAPIFCNSGFGFRLFALDAAKAMKVGNYDAELDVCFEDAELMRWGLAEEGHYWMIHPLAPAVSIGKRFEEGGIAAYCGGEEQRAIRADANYMFCQERWPDYMSAYPKKRMAWKKMHIDYLGEDGFNNLLKSQTS